jgi:hypothetical protein
VIKDTILKDPDLPSVVRSQVTEHYIHHALISADFPVDLKEDLLRSIGEINNKLDTVTGFLHDIATGNGNDNTNVNLASTRQDIARLIELLPPVGYFESLALSCDDKSFFETLIMTIKNVTLSAQHFFYKLKNKTKDTLKKQLIELKKNYSGNQEEIFRLEARLSNVVDSELRDELSLHRNFEKLNDEKITPYFMSLARQPNSDALLSDIRNKNGVDFRLVKYLFNI